MPVDPNTLAQYAGKNVKLVIVGEKAGLSGEGKVDAAGPFGVAFKAKGKATEILEPSEIDSIEASAVVKKIVVKSMQPIALDNVRQHLVDRHGYQVKDIESYAPEQALEFHATLEHAGLAHNHDAKPKGEEAAEASAA